MISGKRSPCPVARADRHARARRGGPTSSKWSRYISARARYTSASRRRASSSSESASTSCGGLVALCLRPAAAPPSAAPAARTASAAAVRARSRSGSAAAAIARSAQPSHRVELRPEEAVDRELDHERDGLRRAPVVELGESGLEPRARLRVPAEKVLDARAGGDEPDAQGDSASAGTMRMLSSSASWLSSKWPVAASEPARASSSSTRSSAGASVGEEAKRRFEPARGGGGRALRSRLAGLAKHRDRGRVALSRRELDVVRARRDGAPRRRERLGAALVRAQPPAARRRLVDGAPNQRMAEAEAARHVRRADEVDREQLVESVDRRALVRRRRGGRQLGLERIARDGGALEHEASAVASARRAPERARPRRSRGTSTSASASFSGPRAVRAPSRLSAAGELLEVEGVAAALLVERRRGRAVAVRAQQLAAPRSEVSAPRSIRVSVPARCARSSDADRRSGTRRGRIASARSTGADGRAVQQRAEQLRRIPSRPSEGRRARARAAWSLRAARAGRERLGACGSARAGAPVDAAAPRNGAREDLCELGADVVVERFEQAPGRGRGGNRRGRRRRPRTARRARARSRSRRARDGHAGRRARRAPRAVRVFPIPGSPTSASAAGSPRSRSARTTRSSRARRRVPRGARDDASARPRHHRPGPRNRKSPKDQGAAPMSRAARARQRWEHVRYLLHHRHEPPECGVVFASFRGYESPLRHQPTLASCTVGRACDLVDGRRRVRGGRARAVAVLRRRSAPQRPGFAKSGSPELSDRDPPRRGRGCPARRACAAGEIRRRRRPRGGAVHAPRARAEPASRRFRSAPRNQGAGSGCRPDVERCLRSDRLASAWVSKVEIDSRRRSPANEEEL